MNADQVHATDQIQAFWKEILGGCAPMLHQLFKNLVNEGFNEQQALILTSEALKKMMFGQ